MVLQIVLGLVLAGSACVSAANAGDFKAVLGISFHDYLTLSPQEVIEECSITLKEKADMSNAFLAKVYLRRGYAYALLGRLGAAKKDLEKSVNLVPGDETALYYLAGIRASMGDLDAGSRDLKAIIKAHPTFAATYCSLAGINFEEKNLKACIENATQAITLLRKNDKAEKWVGVLAQAYYLRAASYSTKKDFAHALEDVNQCILTAPLLGLDPSLQERPYLLRGLILNQLGKHEQAISTLQIARRLNPKSVDSLVQIWTAYYQMGRMQLACRIGKKMISLEKKKPIGYVCLGTSLLRTGQDKEALEIAKEALSLGPREPETHALVGYAYMRLGEYEESLVRFNRALELAPKHAQVLMHKVFILSSCPKEEVRDGQKAKALAIKMCETTKWEQWDTIVALAVAHAECGEFPEGIKLLEKALRLPGANKKEIEKFSQLFKLNKPYRIPEKRAKRHPYKDE